MQAFDLLFDQCKGAFSQEKIWQRAREIAYGTLTCMGRHTITGMLASSGQQFVDWSSAYRIFSEHRVDNSKIFDVACTNLLQLNKDHEFIVGHMDDTIIKKVGKHIPGTAWRRDPMGPPFHTNFIWGQRFLQISLALTHQDDCVQSRAIPVDFFHCPGVKKPAKANNNEQQWNQFKEQQKLFKLSTQGSLRIAQLRNKLDQQGFCNKKLILSVDGSYTNATVLKTLPSNVILIGRIRKDTKLFALPDAQSSLGRKRVYGERLPTPEQIRQSEDYPWVKVDAWAAGKVHSFHVKIVEHTRWRPTGARHNLKLVIIRPLGYRLTKNSKILYRQPAYLICTNPDLSIEKLLQSYLWRWEIEVNFREQKTLFGCGQAQIRNPYSVQSVPAFITSMYALLHIANYKSLQTHNNITIPRPKWYPLKKDHRISSGDIVNNLRAQLWTHAIGMNFSSFVNLELKAQRAKIKVNPNTSAVFYSRN